LGKWDRHMIGTIGKFFPHRTCRKPALATPAVNYSCVSGRPRSSEARRRRFTCATRRPAAASRRCGNPARSRARRPPGRSASRPDRAVASKKCAHCHADSSAYSAYDVDRTRRVAAGAYGPPKRRQPDQKIDPSQSVATAQLDRGGVSSDHGSRRVKIHGVIVGPGVIPRLRV
jgi:hypothetical protein